MIDIEKRIQAVNSNPTFFESPETEAEYDKVLSNYAIAEQLKRIADSHQTLTEALIPEGDDKRHGVKLIIDQGALSEAMGSMFGIILKTVNDAAKEKD